MTRPPITPEEARALLEGATPGPWRNYDDPDTDGQIVYDAEGIEVSEQLSGYDANLIAAAPDLAAVVAGLRVEYAVQVWRPEKDAWWYVKQDGHLSKHGRTGVWCKNKQGCKSAIRMATKRKDMWENPEFRTLARFVTAEPWEVEG